LVAVVLTLVTNKNKYTYTKQYKNAVNTSTHITKTRTQLSKHPYIHTPTHYKTHTYTHSHITEQVTTFACIDWNIFWSRSKYAYMNTAKRKKSATKS